VDDSPRYRGSFAIGARPRDWPVVGWSSGVRYAAALAPTLLAVVLCLTIDRTGTGIPFITFFPAVMIAGWLGGFWPGVISTAFCAATIQLLRLHPTRGWELGWLVLFVLLGGLISAFLEAWRRVTAAVLESERHLRQTLACVADAVISTDRDGIVTGFNETAAGLTGCDTRDALDRPLQDLFTPVHDQGRPMAGDPWSGVLAGDTPAVILDNLSLLARDGRVIAIEGRATARALDDGMVVGLVLTFRDVTARRQAEEQQAALLESERLLVEREQAARAELEHAARLKDEFLAVLSHELRTPMNAVLGYARLLSTGVLPADRVGPALTAIQRNAQAQARLIESLLDSSRVITGKLTLDLAPVDLTSVVEAAVDGIRPDAAAKGIFLHMDTPPEPITLMADGGRLQQVFWNLLSNALKFTKSAGRIDVRVETRPGLAVVTVADDGIGISPDFLPYVFDRFRQADDGRHSAGGLGLGLALVRDIVQLHGGAVSAQSAGDDLGSTFAATLPLTDAHAPGVPPAAEEPRAVSPEVLPLLTILVVDDESDARDLLAMVLESHGANVVTVASAPEGLAALDSCRPDVLVSDLRMPEEDGLSLIRRIRLREREHRQPRLPALAISAAAGADDREDALAAGYDEHIAKPVDVGVLVQVILNATAGKR
jgi:PAS domain S-box-containing protein